METRAILVILLILLIGFGIGAGMTGLSVGTAPSGGEWMCMQVDRNACTRYVTKDEWVNQNCAMNASGQARCQVILEDGQTGIIELSKLDIADKVCVEWECLVEVWGRLLADSQQ